MNDSAYVHGYSISESQRLSDQANALNRLLHHDSVFHPAGLVLEAGCGTGAQTVIVAPQNPQCNFVSIDIVADSLVKAGGNIKKKRIQNVRFQVADVFDLPFNNESFDHIFICFLLEHLQEPLGALASLKRVLKKGGTITAIEGDHGSAYYYPRSSAAQATIQCLIDIQSSMGGNALIGRELYPLLVTAGFEGISVSPRIVYADASRLELVDGFTRKTLIALVDGVWEQEIDCGLITEAEWSKGIADLYRSADAAGTFCYTFFKAVGKKS
jgi:SAM-dependent methyltransferase